jgi:pyridoxine 5-phosphate synthase
MTLSSRAAHGEGAQKAAAEISRIGQAATHATKLGLIVAAGHGLTYRNVGALASIPRSLNSTLDTTSSLDQFLSD